MDENSDSGLPKISRLTEESLQAVCSNYVKGDDIEYIRDRIQKGCMFGAFADGKLAGFIGIHQEGAIGMLEVLPQYRGRGIAKALETYVINLSLEAGHIPYGQVVKENEASKKLQECLGLYFSKTLVYWIGNI